MLKAITRLIVSRNHLLGHRNIFLFSHMRANTSLFGHILGSHPDIEGYYEMHIGYYSWKSLWRQKLLYLESHHLKPSSYIFFDKLLHDYCTVSPEILARSNTSPIFMLRRPEQTIRSIVSLYRKNQLEHKYARPVAAADYYKARILELADIARTIPNKFYYLDAEDIIDSPQSTLQVLSLWLGLSVPLGTEYKLFSKTGAPQAGDSSELIKSGTINKKQSNYEDIAVSSDTLSEANAAYLKARTDLKALCANQ